MFPFTITFFVIYLYENIRNNNYISFFVIYLYKFILKEHNVILPMHLMQTYKKFQNLAKKSQTCNYINK